MKKKYSLINDFNYLGRRFLKKDLAAHLGISKNSLYRYSKGFRKAPLHILDIAKKLRFTAPKKTTSYNRIKKKRYAKITKIYKHEYVKINEKIKPQAIESFFQYFGNNRDIGEYISEISRNDISDNIVYQVIREKIIDGRKVVDSTYNYHVDSVEKITDGFKRLLSKYASGLLTEEHHTSIFIKRTEYI